MSRKATQQGFAADVFLVNMPLACLFPAGHGFAEAAHPGYNELVADQAWELTLAFLREQATAR
jgi:dienelactone hydrolase